MSTLECSSTETFPQTRYGSKLSLHWWLLKESLPNPEHVFANPSASASDSAGASAVNYFRKDLIY